MPDLTLGDIAKRLGAQLVGGDERILISSLAPLSNASAGQLTFLGDSKYRSQLSSTQASAVITSAQDQPICPTACLVVDNPAAAFAEIAVLFARQISQTTGIHATAVIAKTADIDQSASIGPHVVIGEHVKVGQHTQILPNTVIGNDVLIGDHTTIHPNVTVYAGSKIGSRVIIHSGAAIGSDGFGNVNQAGKWYRIPQLGRAIIGDDVDIGANTCIDCGALGDTVIGDGVKLDNLIQVAHNVQIGDHTAMAAQVGIAGSTKIGEKCLFGGKVGVNGHIDICDSIIVTGSSNITKTVAEPGVYASHFPAVNHKTWMKILACFKQLPLLHKKVKSLERQLSQCQKLEESA